MLLLVLIFVSLAAAAAGAFLARPVARHGRDVARAAAAASGAVLGLLALLVGSSAAIARLDETVARWVHVRAGAGSATVLDAVTRLGSMPVVLTLAALVAVAARARRREWRTAVFLAVAITGQSALSHAVKALTDRPRPALDPVAQTLGPAFPSGHSASAAAFYGAVALVLARGGGHTRTLAAAAAALAAAVAASRVLLDVHWLSDVVGGLALGFGWLALTWLLAGRRLLRRR